VRDHTTLKVLRAELTDGKPCSARLPFSSVKPPFAHLDTTGARAQDKLRPICTPRHHRSAGARQSAAMCSTSAQLRKRLIQNICLVRTGDIGVTSPRVPVRYRLLPCFSREDAERIQSQHGPQPVDTSHVDRAFPLRLAKSTHFRQHSNRITCKTYRIERSGL
jgi:hypothetical protein